MKNLRNLVFGAMLAGACLAPAAWADGSLLLKGEVPDRTSLRAATILPLGHALTVVREAFPHLVACALSIVETGTISLGPIGTRNGA